MIKLLLLDVDGTMTDGKIYYSDDMKEFKAFNVKDGMGIVKCLQNGIKVGIITGRKSDIVTKRGSELGITDIYQGVKNKLNVLDTLKSKYKCENNEIAYVGDDWNDINIMNKIGLPMCPADATEEVKKICKYKSNNNGGFGAVRDCIEHIFKENGILDKIVDSMR